MAPRRPPAVRARLGRRGAAGAADPAHLTGLSRLQELGLDFGPRLPVHFVIEGDLHLDLDDVFLHRTVRLPPLDGDGVTPAAAYLAYCRRARVVDAIKVGDWLAHHGHLTLSNLLVLATVELWRDGACEALWVLDHLDGRSMSLRESETRGLLSFAGLPRPEVNPELVLGSGTTVMGDLYYREQRLVVEYEGAHHQADRGQYTHDIGRYELLGHADLAYLQVTREDLSRPRSLVGRVHRELVRRDFDGPAPVFGETRRQLFLPIADVIGSTAPRRRAA